MKKILSAMLAVWMVLMLVACGSSTKTVDVQALADAIKNGIAFEDTMSAVSADELSFSLAGMPAEYTAAAYKAAASTSEEIIVVQCDSKDAAAVKTALETHLAELKDQASKYQPEELERLDGAVLSVKGGCVVLCITADTAAADDIIKEYVG